ASLASSWRRESFWRRTMAPRLLGPCAEFHGVPLDVTRVFSALGFRGTVRNRWRFTGADCFLTRQRLCDHARAVDETFGQRAQRATFYGNGCDHASLRWQLDRQYLERQSFGAEPQHGAREQRKKTSCGKKAAGQMNRKSDHLGRWYLQPACAEQLVCEHTRHGIGRRKDPGLVEEISKFNPSAARPW